MDNFVFSVRNTIEKFNMLNNNDNVVVGVSGGADSTALLYSLISLREIYNINIVCAHLNHGIRGDEAARDERYVRELSQKLNINFFCKHVDIPLIAKQKKQSEELTGREERYKFFNEILNKLGGGKIAVAHNKNDFVETVLIKLTRGASLNGLKGISPVNAAIIRPLIEIERNKIELYLDKNNIKYMTDSTNDKDIYTRNLIRNNVIKELCKIICEHSV